MTAVTVATPALGHAPSAWRRLRESPTLVAGLLLLAAIVIAVLVGPLLTGYSPDQQDTANILAGPSSAHWLGTDQLGRDELTRLLYAGRTDLKVGFLAVLFPFFFGTLMGTIAGYYGGFLDTVVMRIVDILVAFPFYVHHLARVRRRSRYARHLHRVRDRRLGRLRPHRPFDDVGRA